MKAVGTGIACDLSTLSFSCKTPLKCEEIVTNTKLYKDDKLQVDWKFEESMLGDDHCVAVALQTNEVCIAYACLQIFFLHVVLEYLMLFM